jgi:Holliday junction resolvase RusA-like endonuclease
MLLRKIIIPEILRDVRISEKRRKKYFIKDNLTDSLEIPQKYQNDKYGFLPYKTSKKTIYRLCLLSTKDPALKNPIAAGTPKNVRVNFQKIWNNEVSDHTRNKMALALKESYKEVLDLVDPITEGFPLKTYFIFHTNKELQDIDNLSFLYIKTFHDALVDVGIIPDDTLKYIKRYEAEHDPSEDEYIEIKIYSIKDPIESKS